MYSTHEYSMPAEVDNRKDQELSPIPIVGIIMGSDSDSEVMKGAADILEELGIPYSYDIVSAHRTPDEMVEYAKTAYKRGLKVIIAGAGGSAHLPGMTASENSLPIVGVPIKGSKLDGLDSLLSQVQMPAGIPVGVMGIDAAKNAALFAARILAVSNPELYERLEAYRQKLHNEVIEKGKGLPYPSARRYLESPSSKN